MTAQPKPTAADVPFTPTDDEMRYAYARDLPSATSEFDRWLAEHDAQVAAQALRDWIAEWPTTPGDGTFLADVARDGRARADRLAGGAT